MIWYWIGVFIALCVNTVVLFMIAKETKQVTLGAVFAAVVLSLFSWVELGFHHPGGWDGIVHNPDCKCSKK